MRLIAWNCNMALHRKLDALMQLRPDVAVVCECAAPERLRDRVELSGLTGEPVWIGRNPNKGLAVFGFNGHRVRLAEPFFRNMEKLRWIQHGKIQLYIAYIVIAIVVLLLTL